MNALSVLSLSDAKDYLKVDFSDDDELITALISTAVAQVEKNTEYRLYQRNEIVLTSKYEYTAFQYPLNSAAVIAQDSANTTNFPIKTNYETLRANLFWGTGFSYRDFNTQFFSNDTYNIHGCPITYVLTLDVGYTDVTLIPDDLITAVMQIIVFLYENRDMTKLQLPDNIMLLCQPYKRFNFLL